MHTDINLSEDVAGELFKRAPEFDQRSALLERILKEYFEAHPANPREDFNLINENADELNREALDVLDYQTIP
jgi:hypothetical protein